VFHCDLTHITKIEINYQIEESHSEDETAFLLFAQEKLGEWGEDCYLQDGETLKKHSLPVWRDEL